MLAAVQHRGRLHARARRDVLGRVGHDDRPTGRSASTRRYARRTRATADEHDVRRRRGRRRRSTRRDRRAARTRRPRPRRGRGARVSSTCAAPVTMPDASGRFGRALAVEVRHDHHAARARRRGERERVERRRGRHRATPRPSSVTFVALSVHTSGRKRPVASANPATAPVGSAVGVSLTAYTVPDVPSEIATSPGRSPSAERGGHVVAGARARRPRSDPNAAVVPARSVGPSTRGSRAAQSTVGVDDREQVEPVLAGRRGEVAGARRVAAVGDELAGELPREPVVRQAHTRDARPRVAARSGAATTTS